MVLLLAAACGPDESALVKPPASKPLEIWTEGGFRTRLDGPPLSSDARLRRAAELMQTDRLADAAAEYREILAKDPKDVNALIGLSRVAGRMGDAASSLVFISRATEMRPQDPGLMNEQAVALISNGRRKDAARLFDQAIAIGQPDPALLINASLNWADLNEWGNAQQCAERAAQKMPSDLYPWLLLGRFQVRQGRNAESIPYFREASRRGPDNGLVHYHLGKALLATGKKSEAADALRVVLKATPPAEIRKEVEALLAQ